MKKNFTLFWTRADKQGDIDNGSYATLEEAQAAQPAALAEFLFQAGKSKKSRKEVLAGSWSIQFEDEDEDGNEVWKQWELRSYTDEPYWDEV